jgi:DNA-directed RNA polymerase subunit RPC12/RpoP
MDFEIFNQGGPYNIERVDSDKYKLKIPIPSDQDGLIGRECPSITCSPGYFKIKFDTDITAGKTEAYCPYCAYKGTLSDFPTKGQIKYAKEIGKREATNGIERMFKGSLGLDSTDKKKLGGGLLSLGISFKPSYKPPIRPPFEELLRRDMVCPNCKLEHAVFGIATWCPNCGLDIFLQHVSKEYEVVKMILDDVENRLHRLGTRVAARDVENSLEDTVSIFEAVLRAVTRRKLLQSQSSEEVDEFLKKRIANKYQNIELASDIALKELSVSLFESLNENELEFLRLTFEKRHPITHNLGIVDRKYLERAQSGELEGREIRVTPEEVKRTIGFCIIVITDVYPKLFPEAKIPT